MKANPLNSQPARIIEYKSLSREDFDAVVTGELTHLAIWFEQAIIDIITSYFMGKSEKAGDFQRLLMWRDGLTFQDKIEIARAMIPLFGTAANEVKLKELLKQVEDFKSSRNALAHGQSVSEDTPLNHLFVEIVSRSGKTKRITVTPESHQQRLAQGNRLLELLHEARETLEQKS